MSYPNCSNICCGFFNPFIMSANYGSPFIESVNPFRPDENIFANMSMFSDCPSWRQPYNFPSIDPSYIYYGTEYIRENDNKKAFSDVVNNNSLPEAVKADAQNKLAERDSYIKYVQEQQAKPLNPVPQTYAGKTWAQVGITDPTTQQQLVAAGYTPESYEQITKARPIQPTESKTVSSTDKTDDQAVIKSQQ